MATTSHPFLGDTILAGADLSAKQYHFVKISSAADATKGRLVLAGAGEPCLVLENKPTAGEPGAVKWGGIAKVVCGGIITAGNYVAADANAKAKAAVAGRTNTSDAGAAADALVGSHVVGIALEDGAQDQIISVLLLNLGAVATTAA